MLVSGVTAECTKAGAGERSISRLADCIRALPGSPVTDSIASSSPVIESGVHIYVVGHTTCKVGQDSRGPAAKLKCFTTKAQNTMKRAASFSQMGKGRAGSSAAQM